VLVSGPNHGTLTLNDSGFFTYTPAVDYSGADSFTYKANDGTTDSNVATVSLTITPVNDVPVNPGASIVKGVLQIVGTAGEDNVEVNAKGKNNEWVEVKANFLSGKNHTQTFKATDFDSIVIMSGDGNDNVTVDNKITKKVTIDGGSGDDHLMAGGGPTKMLGGDGNDVLIGGSGKDKLYGGWGNDLLIGGSGDDILDGGPGNDRLFGGRGDDIILGGAGNDLLVGGPGKDTLDGEAGYDRPIDWSGKYKYCHAPKNGGFHHTQVSPCGSWVKDFVVSLAGNNDHHNLNTGIQIVLPSVNDNKLKIDSKGCKR
jgi:VCBS repeat-containing protein